MSIRYLLCCFLTLTLFTIPACLSAYAGETPIFLDGGGGDYQIHKVKSLLDMRFHNIIHQQADFSCGSAALATLLTYHYGHPISESEALNAMYAEGDKEKIRKQGFSLLDMKNYLNAIGYHAEGYKASLEKLASVGIPAIVLINRHGYLHFVVVQGVTRDRIATADPMSGLRIYNRQEFKKMWNGILFVVLDHKSIARTTFNTADDWSHYPHFNHMLAINDLGSITINSAIAPNYY